MDLKHKVGIAVSALLLTGGVLAGAAMANEAPATPATPSAQVEKSTKANPLSDAAKAVLQQLSDLRKSYMDRLQTESKGIIDQAVKEGKLTQEEADRLNKHGEHGFMGGPGGFKGHGRHGDKGGPGHGHFGGDLKSKLDAAVKDGTLTQEQATKLLERFAPPTRTPAQGN